METNGRITEHIPVAPINLILTVGFTNQCPLLFKLPGPFEVNTQRKHPENSRTSFRDVFLPYNNVQIKAFVYLPTADVKKNYYPCIDPITDTQ
jgi:hypothetical protein